MYMVNIQSQAEYVQYLGAKSRVHIYVYKTGNNEGIFSQSKYAWLTLGLNMHWCD